MAAVMKIRSNVRADLDDLLYRWGDWRREENLGSHGGRIGETITGRIMRLGPVGAMIGSTAPYDGTGSAAEDAWSMKIDAAVKKIGDCQSKVAEALKRKYQTEWLYCGVTDEQHALRMQVDVASFRRYVRSGRSQVAESLGFSI